MSNIPRNDITTTGIDATEAFVALSSVYLLSIERMAALNLNTAREVVESCSSATRALSEAKTGGLQNLPAVLGQPAWGRALAYSLGAYEIAAKTQEEISNVIVGRLSHPYMAFAVPAGWTAMSDAFAKGVQQFAANAAEKVAAAIGASPQATVATMHARKTA